METSILLFSVLLFSWCSVEGQLVTGRRVHPVHRFDLISVARANPEAKRLYEELIKVRSYNKLIRPVKNNSEKLTVYLGLRLTQLLDVVSDKYQSTGLLFIAVVSVDFERRKESDHDLECVAQAGTRTICFFAVKEQEKKERRSTSPSKDERVDRLFLDRTDIEIRAEGKIACIAE